MYSDGYKYWLAYKNSNTNYYRCFRYISSKCPGRCVKIDGKSRPTAEHNHPPEIDKALVDKFRKTLTYRAATEKTELHAIYCDEASTRHVDAAMLYPFTSAESAMRKARRKQLPQVPNSIGEIINVLDNSLDLFRVHIGQDKDSIYQKTINLDDSVCMIFMHRKTYELFNRIEEILIDGLIEFTPNNPPNYYLITLHVVQGDIITPVVYAILTAKTRSAYTTFFTYIREELNIIPNMIMSDFDQIMQSSLAYIFPEAIIKGCWFHYTDAVLQQMKHLGLQRETAKGFGASGFRMLLVLPLLPAEYMTPGLESLKKWLKEKNLFSDSYSRLCDYVEYGWLKSVGAEKMSIFGATRNLSNHTKNFKKELSTIVGDQNPVIWVILDSITQLATKIYLKTNKRIKTMKSQGIIPLNPSCARSKPQTSVTQCVKKRQSECVTDAIIASAKQLWIKTPVHLRNPLKFLQLCSHCVNDTVCLSDVKEVIQSKKTMKITSNNQKCDTRNLKSVTVTTTSAITTTTVHRQNSTNYWDEQLQRQQQQQQQQQQQTVQNENSTQQLQPQMQPPTQQEQQEQQNQIPQDLANLPMSMTFLDQQTNLEQTIYSPCSITQEFLLASPQTQETDDNDNSSYYSSCNEVDGSLSKFQQNNQRQEKEQQLLLEKQLLEQVQQLESQETQQQQQRQQQQQHQQNKTKQTTSKNQFPSDPPPLTFFPCVKNLPFKRRLPLLSEPPPLVPIRSKILCKKT